MFIIKCLLAMGIIGSIVLVILRTFPPILFDGPSMQPTYKDGEIAVGTRLFNKNKFVIGGIYVYNRTTVDGEYSVVKRLTDKIPVGDGEYLLFFEGDNKGNSTDSRDYGYVQSTNVIAKVIRPRKYKGGSEANERRNCA